MQRLHFTHPDYILYCTNWVTYCCQGCQRNFQTFRHRLAPSSKSMNSALLLPKKPKRWIWVGIDSNFGKVLGFVYCGRTTKTVRELLQKLSHTGLWNWLPRSLSRFHLRHFSTPWQTLQAPMNPSTLDTGITSLGCTTKHCATVGSD